MNIFNRKELAIRRSRADLKKSGFILEIVQEELKQRIGVIDRENLSILVLGARDVTFNIQDFSAKLLIYADIFPGQNINVVLDGEDLPFAPESFDIIFSILDLHSINNVPGHLHQIKHILKHEGLFVAALFGGENLKILRHAFLEAELALNKPVSMHIHPAIDIKTMGMLMQNIGMGSIVVDSDKIKVLYNNFNIIMQDLKQMGESNIMLSRAKTLLGKEVFKKTAETLFAGQQEVTLEFEILYVATVKN